MNAQQAFSIAQLREQLSDARRPVAIRAGRELFKRRGELTLPILLEVIRNAPPEGRAFALHRLLEIARSFPIAPVIAVLDDPSAEVRQAAAAALGGCAGPQAVAALSAVLKEDDSTRVGATAARSLGRQGADAAVNPLLSALQDPEDKVRSAAAEALGATPSERVVPALTTKGCKWREGLV